MISYQQIISFIETMNLTQEQERLAREIASKLDDLKSINLHRKFVLKYSETHLRECLAVALSVKDKDVLVSRGAIYNSQVTGYVNCSRN